MLPIVLTRTGYEIEPIMFQRAKTGIVSERITLPVKLTLSVAGNFTQ